MTDTKKLMDEIISSVKSDLEKAFEDAFQRESTTVLESQIADFGITIFGIIELSGIPLIIKYYSKSDDSDSDKSSLFAGFIAALSNFAKAEFSGKIQDFAINNQRIFFKFINKVIFIASVKEVKISNLQIKDFYVFAESIFDLTATEFLEDYAVVSKDLENLSPWLDNFETILDEYIVNSIQHIKIPF